MSVPVAGGAPQYGGGASSTSAYIPEIYAGKILAKFYQACVMGETCNTDYEGEIKEQGDKVYIRTRPDILISNYAKGQTLNTQRPESAKKMLSINRAKYYQAAIDRIDKLQSDVNLMNDWAIDASEQMKIAWETDYLGSIYADADSYNVGNTAGKVSGTIALGTTGSPLTVGNASGNTSPVDFLLRMGQCLDEQNVPISGRWAVIPTWLATKLKLSDLKNAYLTGDKISPIRNGRIGDVDNFTLYVSNLLPKSGANFYCLAGQKNAVSFASQLIENDILEKVESMFGSLIRGLQVADWSTLKPEALVTGVAIPGG